MKGLFLKDLYNFRPYLKQYVGLIAFFMIFAVSMKSPEYICMMTLIMGISILFSTMSQDEQGGWAFFMNFPIERKKMVLEKYLVIFAFMGVMLVISFAGGFAIMVLRKVEGFTWIATILISAAFYLLVMFILLPATLKFKVEKARIFLYVLILLPSMGIVLLVNFFREQTEAVIDRTYRFITGLPGGGWFFLPVGMLALAVGFLISYTISARVMEKKEF